MKLPSSPPLLALALALLACSGDKASDSTTGTPTTGSTTSSGPGTGASTGTGTGATTGTGTGTGTGAATGTGTGTGAPDTTIPSGSWQFGECMGACRGDLLINGSSAQFRITGWYPGNPPYADNLGTLTATGQAQLEGIAQALVGVGLQPVYGCPDCLDGGAATVTIRRAGIDTACEYEFGNPPVELVDADAAVNQLMTALRTCTADAWVTPDPSCTPY